MSGCKKLLNSAEEAVDEALCGLVSARPRLRLQQRLRVIVRDDIETVAREGKVR